MRLGTVGSIGLVLALAISGVAGVVTPAAGAATTTAPRTVWLCRPGLAHDPCTADRTTTLVAANGSTHTQHAPTAKSRPVDCFYVYPTVSPQPTINANLTIDPIERSVATAQASRFSQVCRVYAPMYRQLTLQAIGGGATSAAVALAYGDVRDAWRDYLAHDNHGRGVVLIGHSQGAGMLIQLIKQEIDAKPKVRSKLTSALLLGGNVVVPRGHDVGGDFAHIPACRSTKQTGCVVAYSSFDHTPPADAIFGRASAGFNRARGGSTVKDPQVLCTNPAALRGGAATVHPYFPAHLALGVLGGAFPPARSPACRPRGPATPACTPRSATTRTARAGSRSTTSAGMVTSAPRSSTASARRGDCTSSTSTSTRAISSRSSATRWPPGRSRTDGAAGRSARRG